ncbi:hypothetical protein FSP39_020331 [Pinctada imbricata]|uniref:G-protein coupled receptors family 2 profile 1 domain-containing protein n=1 Tax=Pinctada imbricata TaxID=66713 RepID=A0AA88YN27_PINIB|nr:hypothetical protein FSP39_020331 [Pinctada imbricata]
MEVGCKFTPYEQLLPEHVFGLVACSYCYIYLFDTSEPTYSLQLNARNPMTLMAKNGSQYQSGTEFVSDINNATTVSKICSSLSDNDCERWETCCRNAVKCCKRQLTLPQWTTNATYCSRTWDGWGCLDDTLAGQTGYVQCPSYVEHGNVNYKAHRPCTENGTWFIHPETGNEWTNYSTCVDMGDQMTLLYVGLACNVLSLILLIPSCVIFLAFRHNLDKEYETPILHETQQIQKCTLTDATTISADLRQSSVTLLTNGVAILIT